MLNITLPMKLAAPVKLAGLGALTVCGLLLADSQRTGPAPQAPTNAKPPIVVAMQEPAAKPAEGNAAPDRGWIGLMLEDASGQGARVVDVFPGGPAAVARVRPGDVITRVGQTAVTSAAAAASAVEEAAPRQQIALTVDRKGKSVELKVAVDSMADFRERYITEMMRRDPRHPKYAAHPGISEADMQAEVVRRLFEQHERLERALNEVLKEVHELRQEVRALKK
ncbi:MAG TPA: PDZ domain-containing protein [Planctomycetaceae bacterium]|nr:PDZ domain-containing protein [Planctomycetaceae bacterium]